MSNNCLNTVYKASVNDDMLAKIGELKGIWNFEPEGLEYQNRLIIRVTSDDTVVSCSNMTNFINRSDGTTRSNPFTMNHNYTNDVRPGEHSNPEGILTITNYYSFKQIYLPFVKITNLSIEDILDYCPGLTEFGLQGTTISGDLMKLADKTSLTSIVLGYLTNGKVKTTNARELINAIAAKRESGTSMNMAFSGATAANNCLVDIPLVGRSTYLGNTCTIYFTSDTTTYPNGWYGKYNNTYYDSEDNVIDPPV